MRARKFALAAALAVLASVPAFAGNAFWTGKQERVQTVTFKWALKCEYNYNGNLFWEIFVDATSCPASVDVQ